MAGGEIKGNVPRSKLLLVIRDIKIFLPLIYLCFTKIVSHFVSHPPATLMMKNYLLLSIASCESFV